ncbi:TPA: hypothetical protein N3018_005024 [Klebsiella pneumoniae]|nr:hypothetical protein [Klebsiella pneumoniae]HCC6013109.1 hypothetical protein [Klebsiella pneumoniae]HCC6072397.1 hypothetical protein [Klebsiella pneumoniae]HCC6184828.1 hypothetical protein [Klebsiella pneumoniae]HCC6253666.1 hypothetical protein [Klebsiella pneumoniae]
MKLTLRPGVAEKVFHITAANECRFNFALNSVKPAWLELALPGAHSDNVSFRSIEHQTPIRSEGLAQYSPDGIIHHHRQGLQCWYALYSSPPGGTIHESWWDRTITLKT